jgi:hypothetical protein
LLSSALFQQCVIMLMKHLLTHLYLFSFFLLLFIIYLGFQFNIVSISVEYHCYIWINKHTYIHTKVLHKVGDIRNGLQIYMYYQCNKMFSSVGWEFKIKVFSPAGLWYLVFFVE